MRQDQRRDEASATRPSPTAGSGDGRRVRRRFALVGCLAALLLGAAPSPPQDAEAVKLPAFRLPVALPLNASTGTQLRQQLTRIASQHEGAAERPIVVLEFQAPEGLGEGSDFGSALTLARELTSPSLRRLRTVAFVPRGVVGHAVLPVLACEEIAMGANAILGNAGYDEDQADNIILNAYETLVQRRRNLPWPVVHAMLDPTVQVEKVRLLDGSETIVERVTREQLEADGKAAQSQRIESAGEGFVLNGRQMRLEYGFANYLAEDVRQLADRLQIPLEQLEARRRPAAKSVAMIQLRGRLTPHQVEEVSLGLQTRLRQESLDMVCLILDSPGGSLTEATRLTSLLSSVRGKSVYVVCFIDQQARGAAALIPLACDAFYLPESGLLGGPGDVQPTATELADLKPTLERLAQETQRSWSLWAGLLDAELAVFQWTRAGTGETRWMTDAERDQQGDPAEWDRGPQVDLRQGISGKQAVDFMMADENVKNLPELKQSLQFAGEFEEIRNDSLIAKLQALAMQPWFAHTMLFVAFFALMNEVSAPGIGVPGFVSLLAFLLFFWAQFLSGTAGWLEVVLFVGGLSCLIIEVFAIPGFGVFGAGGLVMIMASIVLASQTFVVPQNEYQFRQLPIGLLALAASLGGTLVGLYLVRKLLPHAPILKRLMLSSESDDVRELRARREQLVDWSYLQGKLGKAKSQLNPSGKAMIGDELIDVSSHGEWVEPGTPIRVVEVRGNHVYVEPV